MPMPEYGEILLIPQSFEQDAIGQPVENTEKGRKIQCTIENVGRNEWIVAQQGGFQADIMVKVFTASYNGESLAILHGRKYEVYRIYRTGDETELYLGTRVGVQI